MAATDVTRAGIGSPLPPCARVGCSAPAVASFSFQASTCLVWLHPVSDTTPGAGMLCQVHADRLTPPRGWSLQDRRGDAPCSDIDRVLEARGPLLSRAFQGARERREVAGPPATPSR